MCYLVWGSKKKGRKAQTSPKWLIHAKTNIEAEVMTISKSGNSPLPGSFSSFITRDFHDLAGLEVEEAHVWCTGVREYPEGWRKKERPSCLARHGTPKEGWYPISLPRWHRRKIKSKTLPRFLLNQSDLNGKIFKQTKCARKRLVWNRIKNLAWKLVIDNVLVNCVKMKWQPLEMMNLRAGIQPDSEGHNYRDIQIPILCSEKIWGRHQKSVGRLYHSQSQLLYFTLLPFETQKRTSLQERDSLSSHWFDIGNRYDNE